MTFEQILKSFCDYYGKVHQSKVYYDKDNGYFKIVVDGKIIFGDSFVPIGHETDFEISEQKAKSMIQQIMMVGLYRRNEEIKNIKTTVTSATTTS